MYNRLLKGILILGVLMALMASLSSAATCPWFIRGELYTAQCGVIKEVPESQGLLANDPQALEVLDPELITIDPKYGSIKVAANGSFIYSPSPNIRQGTYVWFKYNATNGKCKSLYPAIAKFQIRCTCRPNIPTIDPICLPTTLGEIRDILTEAGAGCYGCGDVSPIIDLSRIRVDKNGNPIAGTYSFCVKCPGCKEQCGQISLIDCANDHPVANDDTFNTIEDTPVTGSVAGNDIPSKDGGNVWSKETDPEHGTVLFNPDGTFTYIPEEGYCGTDKFTYTLKDVDGDSDTATVTINIECVNHIPVANDDTFNTIEDTPVTGSVAGNDIPSKDGGNVWSKETDPEHGTVVLNQDGTFTYTPEEGYCGTDKFTYTLKDVDGDYDTATVTINIECVNHIPVANDDTFNTIEDTPVTGSVAGNDIPSKDGGNVWLKETDPEHGTVVLNQDGSFTYTPEEGYCGTDKFTYTLKDVDGDSDTATVTINIECVNHIPVANDDTFNTIEDTPITDSVAGNDIPSKDGGNVWLKETDPEHGTVVLNQDGTFTYTPEEGYCGTDKFTYTLKDVDGDYDTATVTINIECVNHIPVANDDTFNTIKDTPITDSVAGNDIPSKDGGNVWLKETDPEHGTVLLNPDGTFTYTPEEGYCGTDEFTYTLKDIDGDSDTATVTINIECVNHIPVANDDAFNTIEDTPVTGSVAGNDIPSKDGGNVWSKETDPEHGTVLLNPDGTFTYTPEEGYCGTDEFTYTLKDVDGDSDTATVTINIECVNDIPVANDDSARICQDSTLFSSVADNDIPSKDGENTWSLLSNPAHGTAVVDSDGTYCYTPIEGWSGKDCFTYQLCDIDNDCSQGTVTITVVEKCNCDLISFSQDGCMYPDELEDLIKDVNAYVCAECDDTPEWSFPEWPVDQTTGYVMGGEYTFSVTCHAGGEELENCDSTCEGVILCTCQPAVCPCEAYAEDIIVGCGVSKEDLSALVVADCQDKGDYACDQTPVIDLSGVITDPSTGFVTGGCYTVDCSPSWVECPTARGDVIVECNDIAHAPDICLPIVCVERSGKLSCRDYSLPLYSAALKQMVTAAGGGCADKCSKMSVVLPENINWGIPGLYQYKVVCKDAKGVIIASDTGRLILDDNCGCGPCGCSGFC